MFGIDWNQVGWSLLVILYFTWPIIISVIVIVLVLIAASNKSDDDTHSANSAGSDDNCSNNDWSESYLDVVEYEHKKDIEDKRSTIRSERKYMTDEEIRDKHRGIWDSSDTEQAFKEEDGPHSFIDWLLFH